MKRMAAALRDERGQAMTETALLTFFLFVAGAFAYHFQPEMFSALQTYMNGIYYGISLPIP